MGGSYQCHTCLRRFSRSDSLRRRLESGICKQNEESEDDPSDDSESQQDDEDDNSTNEEDELPQNQSEFDPWNKLLQLSYDSLYDTSDESCETYLKQNPGMEIAGAERQSFDKLKSNYRQALISNYHDLVQMGNILKKKKDPIHKQIVAIAKRLRSEEDYDLAESYAWALKKRNLLLERILDNYKMPKLSTTEELLGTSSAK